MRPPATAPSQSVAGGRRLAECGCVPRPTAGAGGGGWLSGYVVNLADETTDLGSLNADDCEGPPHAVVHIPCRIPPGFHGNWAPTEA